MKDTAEIEKFVRLEDVETECSCASRKCGSHRCGPSTLAWWIIGGLLIYLLVMHSFQFAERDNFRHKLTTAMTELVEQRTQEQMHELVRTFTEASGRERVSLMVGMDERRTQLERLLERAQLLNWALSTPDVERDLLLQQRITGLSARVEELRAP